MSLEQKLKISDIENIFADRQFGAEEFFKFFSVLVPVVKKDGGLHLLYEKRARHMKRQPGEICFPGGEMEEGESPKECALRETWEEIGIPEQSIRVVNRLDTIYTYSNFAMFCYLGIIDESALDGLRLNEDEVESVFTVSIDWLLENEPDVFWTDIVPEPPEEVAPLLQPANRERESATAREMQSNFFMFQSSISVLVTFTMFTVYIGGYCFTI